MKHSKIIERLIRAIDDFEDESLDLTLSDRIANIRNALMWAAFEGLKSISKLEEKNDEVEVFEFQQEASMKQFKIMEKLYESQIKTNKLLGKKDDKINSDFLQALKGMKSSLSPIVRDLKAV